MPNYEVTVEAAMFSVPLRLSVLSPVFHDVHQDPRKGGCVTAAPAKTPQLAGCTELCLSSISFLTGSSCREEKLKAGGLELGDL